MSDNRGRALFEAEPSNHPTGAPQWVRQPEHIKNVFRVRELEAELAASKEDANFQCLRAADKDCVIVAKDSRIRELEATSAHWLGKAHEMQAELSTARVEIEALRNRNCTLQWEFSQASTLKGDYRVVNEALREKLAVTRVALEEIEQETIDYVAVRIARAALTQINQEDSIDV